MSGRRRSAMYRSPAPIGALASSSRTQQSTSSNVDAAVWLRRSPSAVRGRWTPGVSVKTIWPSGRSRTPRTRVRVVWGVAEVIAIFLPRIWLSRVDLPTFGRPTRATNPERKRGFVIVLPADLVLRCSGHAHRPRSFTGGCRLLPGPRHRPVPEAPGVHSGHLSVPRVRLPFPRVGQPLLVWVPGPGVQRRAVQPGDPDAADPSAL